MKIKALGHDICSLFLILAFFGSVGIQAQDNAALTPQQQVNRALQAVDRHLKAHRTNEARGSLAPVLDEGKADLVIALGRVLEQEKNYAEAEQKLRRAAEMSPRDPAPWLHLGSVLTYARQEDGAKTAYARALELARARADAEPENARAHYLLGWAQRGMGQYGAAFGSLERALELQPGLIEALFEQGAVRFFQENWQAAVQLMTQVIDRDATYAQAFYYRGYAASRIGRKDLTINDFNRFLELAPNSPEAQRVRRVVESVSG